MTLAESFGQGDDRYHCVNEGVTKQEGTIGEVCLQQPCRGWCFVTLKAVLTEVNSLAILRPAVQNKVVGTAVGDLVVVYLSQKTNWRPEKAGEPAGRT